MIITAMIEAIGKEPAHLRTISSHEERARFINNVIYLRHKRYSSTLQKHVVECQLCNGDRYRLLVDHEGYGALKTWLHNYKVANPPKSIGERLKEAVGSASS